MASPALSSLRSNFYITIATNRGSTTKRIDGDILLVGRGEDCNLSVDHESISRRHLTISCRRGECWVEDHGSVNGTFINNARLVAHAPVRLKPEDQVILAQSGVRLFISTEALLRKESTPPLPKEEETAIHKAVVTTSTAEERLQTRALAVPETRPVRESQQKAETLVIEAYKKSSHLVHEAEIEAERRVEEIYRRASDTQAKTDAAYQRRLNEAYRSAEDVFQASQGQAEEILRSARERANQVREQADAFVTGLRLQTERDCEIILDEAQVTARELKKARLAEADELIRLKEQQIVQKAQESMNERLSKFEDDLIQQCEQRKKEVDLELQAVLHNIGQLKLETQDLERQKLHSQVLKTEIEKSQSSVSEFNSQLAALRGEVDQLEKSRNTSREQLKVLQEQLRMADGKVKTVQHDTQTQMLNLRAQFEEDKGKWLREEHQRLEEAKLEATRKARKLEKELLEELEGKRERIGREVALLVETQLRDLPKGKSPDLKQIQGSIIKTVSDLMVVMAKDTGSVRRQKSLVALRRREKAFSYFAGALLGVALLTAVQHFAHVKFDGSPVQNKIVNALEQRRLDLEKRRFVPTQTPEYRMNYVDNVIYGENFVDNYLSDDFQDALLAQAMPYLLRTWRIQEDKAIQLLAMNSALVKGLAEKRDKIHPDFVNSSIDKMRAFEKEIQAKVVELLGSQVRLEAYKKFESQFYTRYTQPKVE
jgi:pSer/pThr/pTyr-binding forkhead associated (FHA) protein